MADWRELAKQNLGEISNRQGMWREPPGNSKAGDSGNRLMKRVWMVHPRP